MAADVSVIIPTYNRLWSLPRAVDSCRRTQCRTQIIVVDDGSNDGTWEWLQGQQDIMAVRQPNQGQTWAVNRGTAHADGAFLRFLDSDDFLCPDTIDRQFQTAVTTGADLIYSRVDVFDHDTKSIRENPEPPIWDDFIATQLGESDGSHYLGMLFQRRLVEKVPRRPDFSYRDDRMLLLEVGLLQPKLSRVSGCAGFWVKHSEQMQANYSGLKSAATNWQHLNIYKRIIGQLAERNELTERRRKAACKVLWPLAHWIAYTHLDEACEVAEWIHKLDPDFTPPQPKLLGALYRWMGFRKTEQLLYFRRFVFNLFRRRPPPQHKFPF